MPQGDGTGPRGVGPMTGRADGYCSGSSIPGSANALAGRGFGVGSRRNCPARGQGQGLGGGRRGWWNMFQATGMPDRMNVGGGTPQAPANPELERNILQNKAKTLQAQMDLIKNRLDALETAAKGSE